MQTYMLESIKKNKLQKIKALVGMFHGSDPEYLKQLNDIQKK